MVETVVEVVTSRRSCFSGVGEFFFIKLMLSWREDVFCEDRMKWPLLSLYLHCSLFAP